MRMRRRGGLKNFGWTEILDETHTAPKIEWQSKTGSMKLSSKMTYEVNPKSFYYYEVLLSVEDVQNIIGVLANTLAAATKPK